MGKTWRVEERFRNWGKPPKKTGDEFGDWAIALKHEHDEKMLEVELRELFLKDLHGRRKR